MAELSMAIEKEQMKLQRDILAALSEFSQRTGIAVPSASWECEVIRNEIGHAVACSYYGMATSLATGFTEGK